MENKLVVLVLLAAILTGTAWWFRPSSSPAPSITFKTIDNQSFHLQDFRGKPVIITFWATNCSSCLKEIPDFLKLYNLYHSQGLEIIAVSMPYDIPSHVVALKQRLSIPYFMALDIEGRINAAFGGVALTPTSFLISPDGNIIWRKTGRFSIEKMQERINKILNKH